MAPYRYEGKRRRKGGIKIYVAIILVCCLLSIGINIAFEKGSSVLGILKGIPWKALDHETIEKLRSRLGKDMNLEDLKKIKQEYEKRTDPEDLERIKEEYKRNLHPDDLETLRQVFKRVSQEE